MILETINREQEYDKQGHCITLVCSSWDTFYRTIVRHAVAQIVSDLSPFCCY